MRAKNHMSSIQTRCTPAGREYLKLFTGEPLFQAIVQELAKIVGVLSQFDIEWAVVAVKKAKTKKRQ
jgi:hypothetical protein